MLELDDFRTRLAELPGVTSSRLVPTPRARDTGVDAKLVLRTRAGKRELLVQLFRSQLSHRAADHIAASARNTGAPLLILAPHVGANLAAKLIEAGVNYLDASGNCHINAPPVFFHIEGKTAPRTPGAERGLRAAGYQALFAYLADPTLLDAPLRAVAECAGTSRQPVSDVRHRLLEQEYVFEARTRTRWYPRRVQDAVGLWLHGYDTTVRPSLVWGTYRTQDKSPRALERRLRDVFAQTDVAEFRWGGSAAAFRITGHYRGERTVVHVHATPGDLQRRLHALSDPRGNLVLMKAFGTLNWDLGKTVHPLLVYSEMLQEGSDRAREAALELFEQKLAPLWENA